MVTDLLGRAEKRRREALLGLSAKSQDALGQFFTPARAANLIASMPNLALLGGQAIRVLDPGAGSGMLAAALVARVLKETDATIHVVAAECDAAVMPYLRDTLDDCAAASAGRMTFEIVEGDYIGGSTVSLDPRLLGFDIVIQNPPYRKLRASSMHRGWVRTAEVDAPNLYAAFLALGVRALKPGGQLVAITPRSFANGPYFGAFRNYLLDRVALDRIHVFESRSKVFADTGVLQENIIFSATRGGDRATVSLSLSTGHEDDSAHRTVCYADVVHPDDPHQFIRIATKDQDTEVAEVMLSLPATLKDLGVDVSTGRVVDFRSRACLRNTGLPTALPLVYPGNLRNGGFQWPRHDIRKAQWFEPQTVRDQSMLLPEGVYCVVKRFSAKEERRRIVAAVWSPATTPGAVAFENHLNVLHVAGGGVDEPLARGLCLWLNSTLVDKFFRTFSGHTQVNATDLRTMRLPTAPTLRRLGNLAPAELPPQAEIDGLVAEALASTVSAA